MDGYFRAAGIIPQIACDTDEPAVIEDFVTAGLGVACIPDLATLRLRDGWMPWARISEPACQFSLGIPRNENRSLSRPARAFRENVIARFTTSPLRSRSVG